MEPYLKPPRTTLQPSQNLVKPWHNSGGNLVDPSWNLPQTRPPPALVEPSWNLTSNHAGPPCSPGGTLVEPYLKPPRPPRSLEPWWNPGETLVKPSSNPQPSKKLVEPWWSPRGTLPQTTPPLQNLVEPWWNPGGTLVEPWWNPGGTLVEPWWNLSSGSPRTTPEPIWAETPKLSAVGEKKQHCCPVSEKQRGPQKSPPPPQKKKRN